jgi:hypothetical protein
MHPADDISLEHFNAKVGRENNFKPAIRNENLYETSNDNRIAVINCPHQKSGCQIVPHRKFIIAL